MDLRAHEYFCDAFGELELGMRAELRYDDAPKVPVGTSSQPKPPADPKNAPGADVIGTSLAPVGRANNPDTGAIHNTDGTVYANGWDVQHALESRGDVTAGSIDAFTEGLDLSAEQRNKVKETLRHDYGLASGTDQVAAATAAGPDGQGPIIKDPSRLQTTEGSDAVTFKVDEGANITDLLRTTLGREPSQDEIDQTISWNQSRTDKDGKPLISDGNQLNIGQTLEVPPSIFGIGEGGSSRVGAANSAAVSLPGLPAEFYGKSPAEKQKWAQQNPDAIKNSLASLNTDQRLAAAKKARDAGLPGVPSDDDIRKMPPPASAATVTKGAPKPGDVAALFGDSATLTAALDGSGGTDDKLTGNVGSRVDAEIRARIQAGKRPEDAVNEFIATLKGDDLSAAKKDEIAGKLRDMYKDFDAAQANAGTAKANADFDAAIKAFDDGKGDAKLYVDGKWIDADDDNFLDSARSTLLARAGADGVQKGDIESFVASMNSEKGVADSGLLGAWGGANSADGIDELRTNLKVALFHAYGMDDNGNPK
jgi:hypothetical protein